MTSNAETDIPVFRPVSGFHSKKLQLPSLNTYQKEGKHRNYSSSKPKTSNNTKLSKAEQDEIISENVTLHKELSQVKTELNLVQTKNKNLQKEISQLIKQNQKLQIDVEEKNIISKENESSTIELMKNQFKSMKKEYESKIENLNEIKKTQKYTKVNELIIENRILSEQCDKINKKYLLTKEKNFNLESCAKEIGYLKDKISKQDFIIINLKESFKKAQDEVGQRNQEILELSKIVVEKQEAIYSLNQKLNYQSQLNKKLTTTTENIKKTKEYVELKKETDSTIGALKKDVSFYREEIDKQNQRIRELKNTISLTDFSNIKRGTEQSQIFELRNKLRTEKEHNRKVKEKLKKYEKDFEPKGKKAVEKKQNIPKLKISFQKKGIDEDEECDIFSDYAMNEFTYILSKNFEAKQIDITTIESSICNPDILSYLSSREGYHNYILTASSNICQLLFVQNEKDQVDILSFFKTFLYNNFILHDSTIESFKAKLLSYFNDIVLYSKEQKKKLEKSLSQKLYAKKGKLDIEFSLFDENYSGYVSFIVLKKIIEHAKLSLSNELIEYLIYYMKQDQAIPSLKLLSYNGLLTMLNEAEEPSEDMNDSVIEISNEEYLNKVYQINVKIWNFLKKKKKTFDDYFEGLLNNDKKTIDLIKVVDLLKDTFMLELTSVEIFCIFSKYKYTNDQGTDDEIIDYAKFKSEVESCEKGFIVVPNVINEEIINEKQIELKKEIYDNLISNNTSYERAVFPFHCKMILEKKNKIYNRLLDLDLFEDFLQCLKIKCSKASLISFLVENDTGLKVNIDKVKALLSNEENESDYYIEEMKGTDDKKEKGNFDMDNLEESESFKQIQKEIYGDLDENPSIIKSNE